MESKGYKVRSHTFMGATEYSDGNWGYKYEITFNKSLQHTGRFSGIEKGLDDYVKNETRDQFVGSFRNVWDSFRLWLKS